MTDSEIQTDLEMNLGVREEKEKEDCENNDTECKVDNDGFINPRKITVIGVLTTTTMNNVSLIRKRELHPCQHCGNQCYGMQCKSCYEKMIESRAGICCDCNTKFLAQRKDGTKRKRCPDCQIVYNQKYIATCPFCKNDYHAYLDDGRVFDRCFQCYMSTFHKCERCENKTKGEFNLCKSCYESDRQSRVINDNTPLMKCRTGDCDTLSRYTFCKPCYDRKRTFSLYTVTNDSSSDNY